GAPGVSAATNGLVLYREGGGALIKNYAWFNRAGQALGQLPEPGDIDLGLSSMAPDGRHMALSLAAGGNADLWLIDTARRTSTRFTTNPANDIFPVWSPDGTQILFGSNRRGSSAPELYVKSTTSMAPEELVTTVLGGHTAIPDDWSSDGRFVVYRD